MSRPSRCLLAVLPLLLWLCVPQARAVDGVVLISQATAANGLPGCNATGWPIVICNSGSYRLSGNLTTTNPTAIEITADGVTLDLNGFSITGPGPTLYKSNDPIGGVASSHARITVVNGQIQDFAYGVNLGGSSETVRQVVATGNYAGLVLHSDQSAGADCTADANAVGGGILNGIVMDSELINNSEMGISSAGDLLLSHDYIAGSPSGILVSHGSIGDSVFSGNTNDFSSAGVVSLGNNVCSNGLKC